MKIRVILIMFLMIIITIISKPIFAQENDTVNLAGPNLTDKQYLGNGVYRLQSQSGGHLDYYVYNGNYRIHGSFTGGLTYNFGIRPIGEHYAQIWEVKKVSYRNSYVIFLGGGTGNQVSITDTRSYDGKVPLYSTEFLITLYKPNWTDVNNIDVTFKLQLEQGTTATSYQTPISPLEQHTQLEYDKGYQEGYDNGYIDGYASDKISPTLISILGLIPLLLVFTFIIYPLIRRKF